MSKQGNQGEEPVETAETGAAEQALGSDVPAADELTELDYEQARDRLVDVVTRLEAGGLSLEESLALWERGEALAEVCERHLEGARERIEARLAAADSAADSADGPAADGLAAAENLTGGGPGDGNPAEGNPAAPGTPPG